ncbi:MAG: patatin-like phospholipase family protein [Bacteroidota bacterium]
MADLPIFENLVFEGGGVKGIAYAGAIIQMEECNAIKHVQRVAGTSAGAITASLLSVGYEGKEIDHLIRHTNFKSFEDGCNPFRIFSKYGLYNGNAFLKWIKSKIAVKTNDPDITFKELNALYEANKHNPKGNPYKELRVFATDLEEETIREFSHRTTPEVKIAEAVRASMSIPLFFRAWRFPDGKPDDHLYVDGGVVYNYPLTTFDPPPPNDGEVNQPNEQTLGFFLYNKHSLKIKNDLKFWQLFSYIKYLFQTLLMAQVIDFDRDPSQVERTVKIDDFGIPATDFGITPAQIQKLFLSGKAATKAYLEKKGFVCSA